MTAELPTAPAAAAAPVAAPAPKSPASPAPASAGIPAPIEATPPKPGSAKEGLFARLEKSAKVDGVPVTPPADKKESPAKAPEAKPAEPADEPTEEQIAAEKAAAADPKKKVNPWKLYKEEKAARAKLEQEYAEARKQVGDPAVRKSELEKFQAIEKRAKELEDHIRFVDYSKSAEFQEKYQQPYEQAWARAASELNEIKVIDPQSGSERAMTANDLLELVNMPLQKAREAAESLLGSAANDVMLLRKEIKGLYDSQANALEKARKEGGERLKAMHEQGQAQMKQVSEMTAKHWDDANKKLLDDPKVGQYLKPVDGDVEGNTRLEKGYKFVDAAFAKNPMDPKLTPEERAKVVEQQAAVRHRAASWGKMRHLVEQRAVRISELKKKLAEYEKSTPEMGSGAPAAAAAAAPANAWERLNASIEKRARPGA